MDLIEPSIHELADLYRRKAVSPVEVIQAYLDRIESLDPRINAYITVDAAGAMEQARAAEKRIAAGEGGPLTGVPLAVKDVLCTKGLATTCASNILKNFVPPYDAFIIARLREAGAVILGKTNMDEFAMGSSCEHSAYGPTRNPWNTDLIPGGSSGGSAAATAARLCAGALGTDTGGSIRQPAGHCGVVGLKPTYGRVSRYGLVAFASSLDQAGPITRNVRDAALLMNVIAGHDPADSTSAPEPVPDYTAVLDRDLRGLRVGLPAEYFAQGLDPEVEGAVRAAVDVLIRLGAEPVDVSLPHTEYGVAAYYIVAPAEASSNLARYDGVKYGMRLEGDRDLMDMYLETRSAGFGPEVIRRIMIGTYVLSAGYYDAYYRKATQVRGLIRQDFETAFERCDVLACPVSPIPPFKIGEMTDDPLAMYLTDVYTLCINMAGIPGLSVPCGRTASGLPIGLQLLGGMFQEARLLQTAHQYEQASEISFGREVPSL
ncbi:MAG: Asp-tRNA(Asn)/Glu-tRNA(Gln) amidotransferase subunit GatA [Proteobacteria bacterium]|nr:Asp-tRNA(Asn)/Glu-tRNA(Gln) amidotransferase subunit GatA [Pseudomonadota bacterium]